MCVCQGVELCIIKALNNDVDLLSRNDLISMLGS